MLNRLQKGDNIVMNCGIKGRISEIKETAIKLEVAPKVVITIQKNVIAGKEQDGVEEKKES